MRLTKDDERARRICSLAIEFMNARAPIASSALAARYYPELSADSFRRAFSRDRALLAACPRTHALMLGRGLIANPALARTLHGGQPLTRDALRAFHDRLLGEYASLYPAHVTLGRMREVMNHAVSCFEAPEKPRKAIRKATNLCAYTEAVARLFGEHALRADPAFLPGA